MSKLTKKQCSERLLLIETLLGLHRVLPEQISNEQATNSIFRMQCALSSGKELAEREPQLKTLDHSVFDGLDEKWRFAAINVAGRLMLSKTKMVCDERYWWSSASSSELIGAGDGYDASDWRNSLIQREKADLTGSDLCRAMKNRDKWVLAYVSDEDDAMAEFHGVPAIVTGASSDGQFKCNGIIWRYAVPINNQGEPLTAKEAGL